MKKSILVILALGLALNAFAAETETECPAMNESRTKVIKSKENADPKKTKTVQQ